LIRIELLRDVGGFESSYRFAGERDLSVQLRERGCTSKSCGHRSTRFRSFKAKLDRERTSGDTKEAAS
jgi:hypothetical protein